MTVRADENSQCEASHHIHARPASLKVLFCAAPRVCSRTRREAEAYSLFIRGSHLYEREEWSKAQELLEKSKALYE